LFHAALALWFCAWSVLDQIGHLGNFGGDARLYYEGAAAWLAGRDPWSVSLGGVHFAGLPPTVEVFAPFTILPVDVVAVVWPLCLRFGASASPGTGFSSHPSSRAWSSRTRTSSSWPCWWPVIRRWRRLAPL
jgi:hypothetical protein